MPKRFQVGPLGEHDDQWLTVWSALVGRTKPTQATQLLAFRIRERKQQIEEMLNHSAELRGMQPKELFLELVKNPNYLKENPIEGDEFDLDED